MSAPKTALNFLSSAAVLYHGGDLRGAVEEISRGEKLATAANDNAGLVMILVQRAGWLREMGRMEEGRDDLQRAEELFDSVDPKQQVLILPLMLQEQANYATRAADTGRAIELLTRAKAEAESHHLPEEVLGDIRANLAAAYMGAGRLEEAQTLLLEAVDIDTKIGNQRGLSNDLNMLGLIYLDSGDSATAQLYFSRAAKEAESAGLLSELANAQYNYAGTLMDEGRLEEAAKIHEALKAIYPMMGDAVGEANATSSLANIAVLQNNPEKAVGLHLEAHRLHEKAGDAIHCVHDLINAANAELACGKPEALEHARRAVMEAESLGMLEVLWSAHYAEARALVHAAKACTDMKQLIKMVSEEAIPAMRAAADAAELLRAQIGRPEERQHFFGNKEQLYEQAIIVCGTMSKAKIAFEFSERARSRAFLDTLGEKRIKRRAADDPLALRRQQLTEQILRLGPSEQDKSASLLKELQMVRSEIIAKEPAVAAITETQLPDLQAISQTIPEDGAVIEYFVGANSGLTVFLIGPTGLKNMFVVDIKTKLLEQLVERFRAELQYEVEGTPTGKMLFHILFADIFTELQKLRRLTIVPHGCLNYIPFNALKFGVKSDTSGAYHFLHEMCWTSVVPSAGFLTFARALPRPKFEKGNARVLGNPTRDLDHSEGEAQVVAKHLGVEPLLRERATKKAFLELEKPVAVLHVASHGQFKEVDPLLSGLFLADGQVTVEELLESSVPAGLLTLSGCVTGLSKRQAGEELTGLARAAVTAGIPSVIASLWNVDDTSAAIFFDGFYQYLLAGWPKDAALAQTQLSMARSEQYSNPVHWAPFVLLGDWQN